MRGGVCTHEVNDSDGVVAVSKKSYEEGGKKGHVLAL